MAMISEDASVSPPESMQASQWAGVGIAILAAFLLAIAAREVSAANTVKLFAVVIAFGMPLHQAPFKFTPAFRVFPSDVSDRAMKKLLMP